MVMIPSTKGFVSEAHPRFISNYLGVVSTVFCAKILKSISYFVPPVFEILTAYFIKIKSKPDRLITENSKPTEAQLMVTARVICFTDISHHPLHTRSSVSLLDMIHVSFSLESIYTSRNMELSFSFFFLKGKFYTGYTN